MICRFTAACCTGVILTLACAASPAMAQAGAPMYWQLTTEARRLVQPAALMARWSVPAHIDSLRGPRVVAAGEPATFRAYTNAWRAALPIRLRWDFGDGRSAKGLHAQHRFGAPGRYAVTFLFANRHATVKDSLQVLVVRAQPQE